MQYVHSINDQGIVTVRLSRGKVNALNETVIDEMTGYFKELAVDAGVRAVILTGTGNFFTFGFDIPEFLSYPKESLSVISPSSLISILTCSCILNRSLRHSTATQLPEAVCSPLPAITGSWFPGKQRSPSMKSTSARPCFREALRS